MSTAIIYNPGFAEHESRTSRIRRSRKRPLGEAASSPSSILVREIRRRRCGCDVAAARIFSSATGQKPCTIPGQQHRIAPEAPRTRERRPAPQSYSKSSVSSLSLSSYLSLSLPLCFFLSSLDPPGVREPTRSRSGGCIFPWRTALETEKPDERSASRALLRSVSRRG